MELYVLNKNLTRIAIVDDYVSLIWAKRYNDLGDCEIYIEATPYNIALFQRDYYIERNEDDMICRIKKIELTTDVENGDYLIITGFDCKDILKQRIIWNTIIFNGKVEDYIIKIIRDNFNMDAISPTQRQISNFKIANRDQTFTEEISEQVTHDNLGEKVQSLCKKYEYGYKVFRDGINFMFKLYKGYDKSDRVIFTPEYDNILSTNYIEDSTNVKNVALVGGIGTGKDQITSTASHIAGIDRYEMYYDASSMSNSITYLELKTLYPNGELVEKSQYEIKYKIASLDVILIDNIQFVNLKNTYQEGIICYKISQGNYSPPIPKDGRSLEQLQKDYPNKIILYQIPQVELANLPTAKKEGDKITPPKDEDNVTIANLLYDTYLLNKGYEEIAKNGILKSFNGNVEPSMTFEYKKDYDLGDLVMAENEYGIRAKTRVVETIETFDENGYSIEPKFEFMEVN